MAKAVSFGNIFAARDIAIQAADLAGDATPMLSFLARYGNYLPFTQLIGLAGSYLGVEPLQDETKVAYLQRSLDIGLTVDAGNEDRYVSSLVGRLNPATGQQEFRTIRSIIGPNEGINILQGQITAVLDAWKQQYEGTEFEILAPVWTID